MLRNIILAAAALVLGLLLSPYCINLPISCIRAGLPLCRRVENDCGIDMKPSRKIYRSFLILWALADIVLIIIIIKFLSPLQAGCFALGAVIILLTGIKKTGINKATASNFLSVNLSHYSKEEQKKIKACIEKIQ